MNRIKLVAGNWKMHGSTAFNAELLGGIKAGLASTGAVEVVVCPPFPYLAAVADAARGSVVKVGAQNLAAEGKTGAYTGEVLGEMLIDVGCTHVIIGHSERRALYGETDPAVAAKVGVAVAQGLVPLLCVGETLQQREAHDTEAVIARQLDAVLDANPLAQLTTLVIAYEPVWAIGTGKTASPQQAQEVHAFVRARLALRDAKLAGSTRILYGGSVKPDNAAAIFTQPDVDGGLIGGAALKAADFLAICDAARTASNQR